jgi:hypothetical protein
MRITIRRKPPNDYQPLSRRRRLLLFVLGIGTALTVAWMLLERPGGVHGPRSKLEAPTCLQGRTEGCVGGKAEVIVVPLPPASAPAR